MCFKAPSNRVMVYLFLCQRLLGVCLLLCASFGKRVGFGLLDWEKNEDREMPHGRLFSCLVALVWTKVYMFLRAELPGLLMIWGWSADGFLYPPFSNFVPVPRSPRMDGRTDEI